MTEELKLSPTQKAALGAVCRTNGGGVTIKCRVGIDGVVTPVNSVYRRLYELGLIQGKSNSYSTVVHTKLGLAEYRRFLK